MADNIWIIGATMTKFGRYPDKDSVDLASETALGALADAGATEFSAATYGTPEEIERTHAFVGSLSA